MAVFDGYSGGMVASSSEMDTIDVSNEWSRKRVPFKQSPLHAVFSYMDRAELHFWLYMRITRNKTHSSCKTFKAK